MTDRETPLPKRPRSEIEFILRHAKKRRGPEVLRDISRGEERARSDELAPRDDKPAKRKR